MPDQPHRHDHAALLPQLLESDALIHASVVGDAMDVAALHVGADTTTIVDVGAGTGANSLALAARFPGAQVVAVDVDEGMLTRVRDRVEAQRMSDRISTVHADIQTAGLGAGAADLIWSSNALHELDDPAAAFRNIFRSIRRGGVLLIVEMAAPPSVLPDEYAPLETALRTAAGAERPGPDWSELITGTGFDLIETRVLTSDRVLPARGPGGAYAALELRRLAQHAGAALAAEAITELRALVLDLSGRHEQLDHVRIRGARTLWAARRL